jgi:hypothetical protein
MEVIVTRKVVCWLSICLVFLAGCAPTSKEADATVILTGEDAVQIISDIIQKEYAEFDFDDEFWLETNEGNRIDGESYFRVHAYALGKVMEDGSQTSGTVGWYYVAKETGLAYEQDIGTSELKPISKLHYFEVSLEEQNKMKEKASALFPGHEGIVWRFVEREGRDYCILQIPNQPTKWTYHDYYFYDAVSEELFAWDVEKDVLTKVNR